MVEWLSALCAKEQEAFTDQAGHIRQIAHSSPRFSPVIRPLGALGKKLSAAMGSSSPLLSTSGSAHSGSVSPLSLESLFDSPPAPSVGSAQSCCMTMRLQTIESVAKMDPIDD